MQKQEAPKKQKVKWINPLRDRTRVVPFIVPNRQQQLSALGSLAGEKWRLKKSLQAIMNEFEPIKTPQPGDNLFEYEEDGQGFGLFASMRRNHIDLEKEIIYIGTFHCSISKEVFKQIKKQAKAFFHGAKIKSFHFQNADLSKFDERVSQNGQKYYDAAKMNTHFAKHLPKNTYSIAILTNLLIYNGDNPIEPLSEKWCFGLGSIKDRTSLISFQEIVKKGYGFKRQESEQAENEVNVQFVIKVVNHELCHTFGMKHCIYHTCLMNGTNQYKEAIQKVPHLCPVCLRKLQLALEFDCVERYEAIGDEKSLILAQKIKSALNLNPT